MAFELTTKNGYNMYEMSSMIQKAIRRCDIPHAAYAANELSVKYRNYLWKRLYTISAEDCYGIMTKEIVALKQADDFVNQKNKPGNTNDLFIAKAVILLCMARKNRDADYVACNFMWGDRTLTDEEFDEFVDYHQVKALEMDGTQKVPDYVFDVHTRKGKMAGKTQLDMFRDEQAALEPHQFNLFDCGDWSGAFDHKKRNGELSFKEERRVAEFQKGKELDPTHGGTVWTPETYERYMAKTPRGRQA